MRNKAKRIISILLAIATITSSIVIPANAAPTGVGTDGVSGGGDKSGTFNDEYTGYRMYFINLDGERVSNIVDITMGDPTVRLGARTNNSTTTKWTYNTRFEEIRYEAESDHRFIMYNELNVNSTLGKPLIYESWYKRDANGNLMYDSDGNKILTGAFKPQGDRFREWMMADNEMVITSIKNANINYNYSGSSSSSGGSSGSSSSSGGSSSDSDTATDWSYVQDNCWDAAWTTISNLHSISNPGVGYTRAQAIQEANKAVAKIILEAKKAGYSGSDGLAQIGNSINSTLQAEVTYNGWRDSTTGELGGTIMSLPYTLLDIAYADSTQDAEDDANIYPLLDAHNLFEFYDGIVVKYSSDGKYKMGTQTMAANNLRLIVEPIYWFRPAKISNKKIGDACSVFFYGTVVSYGQWYQHCLAEGKWTDGGKGGWYDPAIVRTGAQALVIDVPLVGNDGPDNPIVGAFDGREYSYTNDELANLKTTYGYAMHYYYAEAGLDLPKIPTYDTTDDPENEEPHAAQDPDPEEKDPNGTIPLGDGELPEPGTPFLEIYGEPEEPGYKNTTRTITIVKTYSKEVPCEQGDPGAYLNDSNMWVKMEHVETFARANCPGTIEILHEPSYKVVEWFTTELTVSTSWGWENVPGAVDDLYSFISGFPVAETDWEMIDEGITDRTFAEEYEWASVEEAEAGTPAKTVVIGLAADPDYDEETAEGPPEEGYYDTTLYVHLVQKIETPETHTLDDPEDPTPGEPISPGPAPDPQAPYEDPNMSEEEKKQLVHKIVKVYETITIHADGTKTTSLDGVFVRPSTAGIIEIEDESHLPEKYALQDWLWSTDMDGTGASWEEIKGSVSPVLGSGNGPEVVDIRNLEDIYEPRTLYVYLNREVVENRLNAEIDIEQSQISKAIHTNDPNISEATSKWGDYEFKLQIGVFEKKHTYYIDHGCCRNHRRCRTCHGHNCRLAMPGIDGDEDVVFLFEQIGGPHELQIADGVHGSTTRKVYSKVEQPEKVVGLNYTKYQYSSDGREDKGEELVTVLWRGTSLLNDIPTLAKYKQKDIQTRYGSANWEIPQAMLKNASNVSKVTRRPANNDYIFFLEMEFGINKDKSDILGIATCSSSHRGEPCPYYCERYVEPYGGTEWTYQFNADTVIRVYKAMAKALAAQPFGGAVSDKVRTVATGTHFHSYIVQGTQQIKFFPYIKMTYMTNSLTLAILEEQNQDVYTQATRYETYVLSEYESAILPSDALEIGWSNSKEKESLLLTSQQWSLHQRAINGGEAWNGTNQVLPGGAIYQLSTPNDRITNVKIITYQTIVDDKTRDYLSVPLTGDEYTVKKVYEDHKDFVNDVKEVLDNLKIVQWVSKDYNETYAWGNNWAEISGDGKVCIRGGGESLTELGLSMKTSSEEKYYMHKAGAPTSYQDAELKDTTYNVMDGSKEKANEGDLDIIKISQVTTVFKVFTDTAGNVYLASMKQTGVEDVEAQINSMINSMKDLNADTMSKSGGASIQKLCDKNTSGAAINSILTGDAKQIDDRTSFITNAVMSLNRNLGYDKTAAWAVSDGKWYNEAFDGIYLARQAVTLEVGLQYSASRASALDPALCPENVGQSDLYTNAFLSQFCLDAKSDAAIAQGKDERYIGTFKEGTDQEVDVILLDMQAMYQSRKFYIPNANVQDLN